MALTHPHAADAFATALFARVANVVAAVRRGFGNWRQFRRLHEMSDHELADIGLERSDLFDAWSRRIDTEPTRYLDALVRSRGGIGGAVIRIR